MTTSQSALFLVMVAVAFGTTLFVMGYISSHFQPIKDFELALDSKNTEYQHPDPIRVDNYESSCPSVLQKMTQGHWMAPGQNIPTWTPSDPRCRPQQYNASQACHLLDGGTIRFIGDSLLQHIYIAFLMSVRGNFKDGGIRPSDTRVWKKICSGMNMFTQTACLGRLDTRPNICKGRVKLNLNKNLPQLIGEVTASLNTRKTLFVVGIDIREDYNSTNVQIQYLKPTLDRLRKIGILWPKVLFVDMDAPGIMKRSDTQSKSNVLLFNRDMEKFLKEYEVPVLKTFNMTEDVRSFDGTHYALGVNVVKANVILNYIQELSDAGVW
ncbi:uncharacterized protein [Haliotis asinina]|uniref:uncharacterized protein n=1 Tax=Haliotis asinina TaxID=109174 RepID=UPI0035321047